MAYIDSSFKNLRPTLTDKKKQLYRIKEDYPDSQDGTIPTIEQ